MPLRAQVRVELHVAPVEPPRRVHRVHQLGARDFGPGEVELRRLEAPPGVGQLGPIVQPQILAPRDDRHRIEKARQVFDRVLDLARPGRRVLEQLVEGGARLEEDALVAGAQGRQRARPRVGVQIFQRVVQRRDDAVVAGGADALGVPAEEEGEIRGRLPHDDAGLEIGRVARHHVLPVDLGDERTHLVDELAQPRADAPAELEQVADQHPRIADDLGTAQPLAEVGDVAAHARADGRHQLSDLELGALRALVEGLGLGLGRPEGVVEVVDGVRLGGRRELGGGQRDALVDLADGAAHHRRQLFPEREGVAALLFIRLVAHQIEVGELEDRLRRRQQEADHPLAQALLEALPHLEDAPLDSHVGLVFGRKNRLRDGGHRRIC